jgi:hypothetical protein
MSYWEIWDSFSKVKKNWDENRELLTNLVDFLNQKSSIEKEYASGLKRLSKSSLFKKGKNSTEGSIQRLQILCSQESSNLESLITHQQSDLIPSLKSLISSHDTILKSKTRYCQDFELELQKTVQKVETAKQFYFNACDSCGAPGDFEASAETRYQETVKEANRFLKTYEETLKPTFEVCQIQDCEKLKVFQESLRKLVVFQMAHLRFVQYELELLPKEIDSVSFHLDLKKFIYDSISEKPFKEFTFEKHPKCEKNEMKVFNRDDGKGICLGGFEFEKGIKEEVRCQQNEGLRKRFFEKLQVKKTLKEFLMN